jgi:hypothetical protein
MMSIRNSIGLRWWVGAVALAVCLGISAEGVGQGRDGGEFDGAVWRFTMTPKLARLEPLRAQFRVNGDRLYQRKTLDDPDFTRLVGKKVAGAKLRVRIEFTDLRAANEQGRFQEGIQGVARLTLDRAGHWEGEFVDSQGRHWNFKCTRIQE